MRLPRLVAVVEVIVVANARIVPIVGRNLPHVVAAAVVHAEDEGDVAALDLHVGLNGVVHLDGILEHVIRVVFHFAKVASLRRDGAVSPSGVILPVAIRCLEVLVVEHVARLVGSHLEIVVGGGLVDVAVVVLTCTD